MSGSEVGSVDQDDRDIGVIRGFRDLGRRLRIICEPLWSQWHPSGWLGELDTRQSAAIGGTTLRRPNLEDPLFVVWSISNTWDDVFDRLLSREVLDALHEVRIFRNRATHPGHEHGLISSAEFQYFETLCGRILAEFSMLSAHTSESQVAVHVPITSSELVTSEAGSGRRGSESFASSAALREVVPIYLLIDRSDSMSGGGIEAVNSGLASTLNELGSDPLLNDRCRISILQFNQRCQALVSHKLLRDAAAFAPITSDGTTNWGEALRVVRREISKDVGALAAQGYKATRPLIFMISDGAPLDDDWHEEWAATANPGSVDSGIVFFYGVGAVPAGVFTSIVTIPGMSPDRVQNLALGSDLAAHISVALGSIMGSVVATIHNPDLRVVAVP